MLKSIDVLIGLIVVVLALSMAVTVITQSITTLFNSRGRHLRRGLTDLLQQLDPTLTAVLSERIATAVLTHPLVSGSNLPFDLGDGTGWRRFLGGARLGNVVHREEFTKLLIGLASDRAAGSLTDSAKAALKQALANNGVADPDGTLKAIRRMAMQLEESSPRLSNTARQTAAILKAAESDFVAKINSWFDQTMDRTSQRFTASTRAITFFGAFVVAFGLQVDTPMLYNRLSADEVLRDKLVRDAQALPSTSASPTDFEQKYRDFLAEAGVINLPSSAGWRQSFEAKSKWGMLVTALLLSFGAPFWYGVLRNLLQLRSVLAVKDDQQRNERQLSEKPAARGAPPQGASSQPTTSEQVD
jgi:hypothetical protein